MADPVLSIRDLAVGFSAGASTVPAVRGIDIDIFPGEVLGIVGESGSGKSVTALAILGLLPPSARVTGSIRLGGVEVTTADAATLRSLRGRDVGMVFQDPTTSLNPVLPVGRQVVEGQVAHGLLAASQARDRAIEKLREVDMPDPAGRVSQYPHQFSGGMRQRAVIAMAMAGAPKLIIADEPTTALDVTVQAQVLALLARRQAETGAAIILITHDLGVVAEMAHRVAVMYAGRVVEQGPVAAIFANPRHPYTAALLHSLPRISGARARLAPIQGQPPTLSHLPPGCSFEPRCAVARGRAMCATTAPTLRPFEPDHTAACHFPEDVAPRAVAAATPEAPRAEAAPLLVVQGLRVEFPVRAGVLRRQVGAVRAVDGVDLVVRAGETLGLVGESGCGKTTTGRAIMGLVRASGGRVLFDGQDITHLSREKMRAVRRRMQYVFQDPFASLNPVLTAGDIVAEPLRIHGLYDEAGGAARIAELFSMVGLSPGMMGRYPHEFSGGQKQRIGIARALALQPRLLILDEPVAALDVSIQAQVVNLLQDLQQQLGLAYLFIAHDLSVVRQIADRVAVMYLGRVVETASAATLFASPVHPYTQALLSAVPVPDPGVRGSARRIVLAGEIPNPAAPPSGCTFHPRCFRADARCTAEVPAFLPYPGQPSFVACHHAGSLPAMAAE